MTHDITSWYAIKKTYDSFKFLVKSTWGGWEWESHVQDKLLNVCNLFKCPGTISFWILPCLKGKQMTFIAHVCHPSQYHGVKISRVAIVHICRSNQCLFFLARLIVKELMLIPELYLSNLANFLLLWKKIHTCCSERIYKSNACQFLEL